MSILNGFFIFTFFDSPPRKKHNNFIFSSISQVVYGAAIHEHFQQHRLRGTYGPANSPNDSSFGSPSPKNFDISYVNEYLETIEPIEMCDFSVSAGPASPVSLGCSEIDRYLHLNHKRKLSTKLYNSVLRKNHSNSLRKRSEPQSISFHYFM